MIKRHMRKSQQYPNGQIVEREGTIHISNVMKVAEFDARQARHGVAVPAQA
jgi:large subunit ribosomal protein L24